MPLTICTVIFAILFIGEGIYYLDQAAGREQELARYQEIEHPRQLRADSYLDIL